MQLSHQLLSNSSPQFRSKTIIVKVGLENFCVRYFWQTCKTSSKGMFGQVAFPLRYPAYGRLAKVSFSISCSDLLYKFRIYPFIQFVFS